MRLRLAGRSVAGPIRLRALILASLRVSLPSGRVVLARLCACIMRAFCGTSAGTCVGENLSPDLGQGVGEDVAEVVQRTLADGAGMPRGCPQLRRELDGDSLQVTEGVRPAAPEPLASGAWPARLVSAAARTLVAAAGLSSVA